MWNVEFKISVKQILVLRTVMAVNCFGLFWYIEWNSDPSYLADLPALTPADLCGLIDALCPLVLHAAATLGSSCVVHMPTSHSPGEDLAQSGHSATIGDMNGYLVWFSDTVDPVGLFFFSNEILGRTPTRKTNDSGVILIPVWTRDRLWLASLPLETGIQRVWFAGRCPRPTVPTCLLCLLSLASLDLDHCSLRCRLRFLSRWTADSVLSLPSYKAERSTPENLK